MIMCRLVEHTSGRGMLESVTSDSNNGHHVRPTRPVSRTNHGRWQSSRHTSPNVNRIGGTLRGFPHHRISPARQTSQSSFNPHRSNNHRRNDHLARNYFSPQQSNSATYDTRQSSTIESTRQVASSLRHPTDSATHHISSSARQAAIALRQSTDSARQYADSTHHHRHPSRQRSNSFSMGQVSLTEPEADFNRREGQVSSQFHNTKPNNILDDKESISRSSHPIDVEGNNDILSRNIDEIVNARQTKGESLISNHEETQTSSNLQSLDSENSGRVSKAIQVNQVLEQEDEPSNSSRKNKNKKRKKSNKRRKRNRRNRRGRYRKIDSLIAKHNLTKHVSDEGGSFYECCPSKLVVLEKQVGKARNNHAVEIHPESQYFYERVCVESFEGAECIFPSRGVKSWVTTRCAPVYSYSQVIVSTVYFNI